MIANLIFFKIWLMIHNLSKHSSKHSPQSYVLLRWGTAKPLIGDLCSWRNPDPQERKQGTDQVQCKLSLWAQATGKVQSIMSIQSILVLRALTLHPPRGAHLKSMFPIHYIFTKECGNSLAIMDHSNIWYDLKFCFTQQFWPPPSLISSVSLHQDWICPFFSLFKASEPV